MDRSDGIKQAFDISGHGPNDELVPMKEVEEMKYGIQHIMQPAEGLGNYLQLNEQMLGNSILKYAFAGEAQLINAYAEQQGPDAKDPLAVLPVYGMTLERAVTDTPQRGAIYLDDLDCIYTVHATSVYKVKQSGAATRIGSTT